MGFGATRGSVVPGKPESRLFDHVFITIVIGSRDRSGWCNVQRPDAEHRVVLQLVSLPPLVYSVLTVNRHDKDKDGWLTKDEVLTLSESLLVRINYPTPISDWG